MRAALISLFALVFAACVGPGKQSGAEWTGDGTFTVFQTGAIVAGETLPGGYLDDLRDVRAEVVTCGWTAYGSGPVNPPPSGVPNFSIAVVDATDDNGRNPKEMCRCIVSDLGLGCRLAAGDTPARHWCNLSLEAPCVLPMLRVYTLEITPDSNCDTYPTDMRCTVQLGQP